MWIMERWILSWVFGAFIIHFVDSAMILSTRTCSASRIQLSLLISLMLSTEWIKDNLNPVFQTKVELQYVFEKKQHLRITVLDVDDPKNIPTEYTPNVRVNLKRDKSLFLHV